MIYKRGTAQIQAAGIDEIVIVKRLWGAAPEHVGWTRQQAVCFVTWQEAVRAVLEGYRPRQVCQQCGGLYSEVCDHGESSEGANNP